tara:strand:- start:41617 stop:41874 length:258 start_codon:yes stop_codon:yes gene_type:complete
MYKITEQKFLNYILFHGSDQELTYTLKALGEQVVDSLQDKGESIITIQSLMNEALNVWSGFLEDYPKDKEPDFIDIEFITLIKKI